MAVNGILQTVSAPNPYQADFLQAQQFAEQIYGRIPPAGINIIATQESYYVDHGLGHISRIITKLNSLNSFLDVPLNNAECFILLMATYFHDISMFIGRRANENPEQIRCTHNVLSAEIIQRLKDNHQITVSQDELEIIKNVIIAHRQIDLTTLPLNQRIEDSCIRTRLLGAFLRIADACDCDRSRAPKAVFDLFYDNIPDSSKHYWELHPSVTDVDINRSRSSIVISINFNSTNVEERIGRYRIANFVKKKIESELKSADETFERHGVFIVRVAIKDFTNDILVDLQSSPAQDNMAIISICSNSEKTQILSETIGRFVSTANNAIPLVVEFSPVEGPLFVDTGVKIDSDRLGDISSELEGQLGADVLSLGALKGKSFRKITTTQGGNA
jgi:hypothetical protein